VDVRTAREGVTYEELLREKYYDYFRIGTTLIPGIGKYVI